MSRAGAAARCGAGERGFTLIELLVVLAILGLMAGLAAPRLDRSGTALRAAAQQLADALREGREAAILANAERVMQLDPERGAYRLEPAGAAGSLPEGAELRFRPPPGSPWGAPPIIRFFPDGSSSGGAVALALGATRREVAVHWLTGGVSIHDR